MRIVEIKINPTPYIDVVVANDTICDEGTSTVEVSSLTGLTAGEVLFDYTIENVSGPLAVISGQNSSTRNSLGQFTQTLNNHTDQVQWVEYRIHPYAANTGSGTDCDHGTSQDTLFRIYVNPSPTILVAADDTICDEGISTISEGIGELQNLATELKSIVGRFKV